MMLSEFTSVTTIHALMPDLVPTPQGWGKYKVGSPETYFFFSGLVDMDTSAPEPAQFTVRLAEMHRKSSSPGGMFRFPVTTCDGKLPHTVAWEASCATFFAKLLQGVLKLDTESNGVWPELEAAAQQVIGGVIPRLLGVLQSGGRELKPSLIHGARWEGINPNPCAIYARLRPTPGNVGTRLETGDMILYDAGSYYAHNEMELGIWRCQWGQFFRADVYSMNYRRNYKAAEPLDEWDDRNRLSA